MLRRGLGGLQQRSCCGGAPGGVSGDGVTECVSEPLVGPWGAASRLCSLLPRSSAAGDFKSSVSPCCRCRSLSPSLYFKSTDVRVSTSILLYLCNGN